MSDEKTEIKSPEYVQDIRPMITELLGGYDNVANEWDQDDTLPAPTSTTSTTSASASSSTETT